MLRYLMNNSIFVVAALLTLTCNHAFGLFPEIFAPSEERPCGDLQSTTIPERPPVTFSEVLPVIDLDGDGRITEADVNETITLASERRRPGQFVGVDLSDHQSVDLRSPILIKSGVLLFSNRTVSNKFTRLSQNQTSFTSRGRGTPPLIEFEEGARWVGLSGFHIRSGYSRVMSMVQVSRGVQGARIYNNLIVDEYGEGRREESGNLDGTPAIGILDSTRDIVIDSNTFQHVTFAVKSTRALTRNVTISRNKIYNWRAKAIWFAGAVVNGVDRSAADLTIVQNYIAPPKLLGGIRQPINISSLDDLSKQTGVPRPVSSVRRSVVQFNKVLGPGLAHEAELGPDGQRSNTGGTADMISFHNAIDFLVDSNCLFKGGEVGINASLGSRDGIISNNLVVESDLSSINIGIGDETKIAPRDIIVTGNTVIDAGRDRANENTRPSQRHHISGIHLENTSDIEVTRNFIASNDDATHSPPIPFYGIAVRRGSRVRILNDNRFRLPSGIIPVGNPASE
jgi:hypothetical protein